MKSILISLLIIGILVILALKPWVSGPEAPEKGKSPPVSQRFMNQCRSVAANIRKPDDYCRCLWEHGLRNPGETLSSSGGRKAATECEQLAR